ncbi:carbohydrate ABC transporter permease [Vallitalea okinawensis]|uniref:carbohydrate ABC transporter permease n=1 Tax=Vallitalea okinawensis TaxID=2078660 RepID=UPI000CFB719E|nr:sugar ABC transporter permease [Vallitalea okinawensis]
MNTFFSNKKAIAIFVLPTLLLFTVIVFYPLLNVMYGSFFDYKGLTPQTFIGLEHYKRLMTDSLFYTSLKNGLIFAAIITVYQIVFATILAFAVNNATMKGRSFFRVVYFIPVVLSITVVCQLWLSILNAENGLLNQFFEIIGLDYQQDWLSDRYKAIFPISFTNAWQYMGYHFALILAGIKSIPQTYYEAAKIDGASTLKAHLKITIPMLAETYKFCLIMAVTGGLNAYTNMHIMTSGGPGTSTYTLTYMMVRSINKTYEFGYGMSSAVILVLECLLATIFINRLLARDRIQY